MTKQENKSTYYNRFAKTTDSQSVDEGEVRLQSSAADYAKRLKTLNKKTAASQAAEVYSAVGRRKEAIARVRLMSGGGVMTINGKPMSDYFKGAVAEKLYQKPFIVTNTLGKYSGSVLVEGGGLTSQLDAVVHGFARALSKADTQNLRKLLKKEGLLTRDARVKERRKYGHAQKARAMKQSPKR